MELKEKKIRIIESNGISVSLGYFTIGEGAPKTLMISGVHGNEKTGQIVIKRLLEKMPDVVGTLTILPIANPTGFSEGTRQESSSGLDLNRNFFETSDNAIIQAVLGLVKTHQYVIDLHNITTDGWIQALSNHINDSDNLAASFNPDVVRTSGKNQALKKTGTLSQYTKDAGIAYVLLELPTHSKVSQSQIDKVVSGLIWHLQNPGQKSPHERRDFSEIPKVGIRLIKAEVSGVFIKHKNLELGKSVTKGDVVGEIVADGAMSYRVVSIYGGIVCEIDGDESRAVNKGDTLVGIGEPA